MWLKVFTTVCIIFSIAMLLGYAWIVGPKPARTASRQVQIAYLRRGATYVGIESIALIGSVIGAYFVARRAKAEYLEQSRRNMEALLEATLRDHGKKNKESRDAEFE